MKKKSRHAILKRKHEFRYYNQLKIDRRGRQFKYRHPSYIFMEKGSFYIFVTLTHSTSILNHVVIKLKKNPNPKDRTDAFYVAEVKEDTKDRFGKRLIEWKIDESDDKSIRESFEKLIEEKEKR